MKLLPFMDVPVIEDVAPTPYVRMKELLEWANGNKAKLSAAFLAYENDGESPEDYLFQIAFIKEKGLVTSKKMIEDAGGEVMKKLGEHCLEYEEWKEHTKTIFEIRYHLEMYYTKINKIPPWGESKYTKLKTEGFTPRVLEGPHKGGMLRPNQRRWIILDSSNEIVFGPMI